jgi:hypothetical protein
MVILIRWHHAYLKHDTPTRYFHVSAFRTTAVTFIFFGTLRFTVSLLWYCTYITEHSHQCCNVYFFKTPLLQISGFRVMRTGVGTKGVAWGGFNVPSFPLQLSVSLSAVRSTSLDVMFIVTTLAAQLHRTQLQQWSHAWPLLQEQPNTQLRRCLATKEGKYRSVILMCLFNDLRESEPLKTVSC